MTKKKWWATAGSLMTCLVLFGAMTAPAAEDEKGKSYSTTGEKKASAASIDFAADLELDFPCLKGLGLRIDRARSGPDPVGLGAAAKELSVAEKVSGKTAALKAADLLKEAVVMAQRRNRPDELKALALMLKEGKASKALGVQADKAKKELEDRKNGEKTRGIEGRLYVINSTNFYVKIFVNYRYVGTVDPHSTSTMFVGAGPFSDTVLYGEAPGTTLYWGPRRVTERLQNSTWTLN